MALLPTASWENGFELRCGANVESAYLVRRCGGKDQASGDSGQMDTL